MQDKLVRMEMVEAGIAVVTIDRPDALNALNREVLSSLKQVFGLLASDPELRVVVLTGAGKAFVAGADIKEMAGFTATQAREYALFGQGVFDTIEGFPRPVIAAVNGFALGGGCELAMACDMRIASEKAKFGQPEVSLGVTPGFGGTQRLPRLVGAGNAKWLLYTGEVITAERAFQIGLVQEVLPPEALLERCLALARVIRGKAPGAVSLCKQAVDNGLEADLARGLRIEAGAFAETFSTLDQREGMTAFLEKRAAKFENH